MSSEESKAQQPGPNAPVQEVVEEVEEEEVKGKAGPSGPACWSPYSAYHAWYMKLERKCLERDLMMKEDLERFLMEVEDRSSWIAFQLNDLNYKRMIKNETIAKISRREADKNNEEEEELKRENGINYFRGQVIGYRKWQNSAAKYLDLEGHERAILAVKLSKCSNYVLSSSEDRTMRLWDLKKVECIRVFKGHGRVVTDCDFHPMNFVPYSKELCLLSCSGDSTLRLWNAFDSTAKTIVKGHAEGIYRCAFSPNGGSFVSSSEDKTIRLWCFPEAYLLFIFRGHTSPVTALNFSPTGI